MNDKPIVEKIGFKLYEVRCGKAEVVINRRGEGEVKQTPCHIMARMKGNWISGKPWQVKQLIAALQKAIEIAEQDHVEISNHALPKDGSRPQGEGEEGDSVSEET